MKKKTSIIIISCFMLALCLTAFVSNHTNADSVKSDIQINSDKKNTESHRVFNEKCEPTFFDDSATYEERKSIILENNGQWNEEAQSFPIDYDNMVFDTSSTFIEE